MANQDKTHNVTDLPKPGLKDRINIKKGATYGIYAAGVLYLVHDAVTKFGPKRNGDDESTPEA